MTRAARAETPPAHRSTVATAVRLGLGLALLLGAGTVSMSCIKAAGLDGYQEGVGALCANVERCFPTYKDCTGRISALGDDLVGWLETADRCLGNCDALYTCLDDGRICKAASGDPCDATPDCCGASSAQTACVGGFCCAPFGIACDPDNDTCCPGSGGCDPVSGTCGGVTCDAPGAACLNDFQCCTGRCDPEEEGGKTCREVPCGQTGFDCVTFLDCCDGFICDNGVCSDPVECSALGEGCNPNLPCCDTKLQCFTSVPGQPEGVCSNGPCFPNNADCFSHMQCCSGYCDPKYNFCGACGAAGDVCSDALPCCPDQACEGSVCVTPSAQ